MTLVFVACVLAVLVLGLVWSCWDIHVVSVRDGRASRVQWERALRQPEDEAWQNRELHYQAAIAISLCRREADSFQALLEMLPDGRTLEVVA